MMAAISEGVNIRERTHNAIDSIVSDQMFAQTTSHEGPTDVRYFGPQVYNSGQSDVYTPFSTPWESGTADVNTVTMAQTNATFDTRKGEVCPDEGCHEPSSGSRAQTMAEKPFYEEFAQESATRRCSIAMQRNWNTTDDYNTLKLDTANKFVDVNFPIEDAIYWQDFGEAGGLSSQTINWQRISEPGFPSSDFWGPNGISVMDIRQGYIGNCWIMAAISALAEHEDRVQDIMISNGKEEAGIYAMNMYSLGIPFTQIIDDRMPMRPSGNSLFAGLGQDGSFWAMIVEKMFAKWYGNWEHLVGGWMNLAVSAMNGSPWVTHVHNNNGDDIWNYVSEADQDRDIITAASQFCGSDSE